MLISIKFITFLRCWCIKNLYFGALPDNDALFSMTCIIPIPLPNASKIWTPQKSCYPTKPSGLYQVRTTTLSRENYPETFPQASQNSSRNIPISCSPAQIRRPKSLLIPKHLSNQSQSPFINISPICPLLLHLVLIFYQFIISFHLYYWNTL